MSKEFAEQVRELMAQAWAKSWQRQALDRVAVPAARAVARSDVWNNEDPAMTPGEELALERRRQRAQAGEEQRKPESDKIPRSIYSSSRLSTKKMAEQWDREDAARAAHGPTWLDEYMATQRPVPPAVAARMQEDDEDAVPGYWRRR
jgi:hypothetical protein